MEERKEFRLENVTEPIKETYNPDGSNDLTYIGLEHIEQETLRLNSVGVFFMLLNELRYFEFCKLKKLNKYYYIRG